MKLLVLTLLGALLWFIAALFFVILIRKLDKKPQYAVTFVCATLILLGGIYGIYKLGVYWNMVMPTKIILALCAIGVLAVSMAYDRKEK